MSWMDILKGIVMIGGMAGVISLVVLFHIWIEENWL